MTQHKKRVLLTGASGFTGQWLRPLLEKDFLVMGLTAGVASPNDVSVDLTDSSAVEAAVTEISPAAVIHLAALSFVAEEEEKDFYRTNVEGTLNLARALARLKSPPENMLVASSANVYGNVSSGVPLHEGFPLAPVNHYGASKAAMEMVLRPFMTRLRITILRCFNYTGPGQKPNFLVPKIVQHFRERIENLELGNTHVERDFTDVRDVAAVYRNLLSRSDLAGSVFNVCSGRAISIEWILQACHEITGFSPNITQNGDFIRANEIQRLIGDNRRLTETLGSLSFRPFRETLADMLLNGE